MRPGERLKEIRKRIGITTREVEEHSRSIAESEGNDEFFVSNAWLSEIENSASMPGAYKLFSLSAIYGIQFTDLFLLYGLDWEKTSKYWMNTPQPRTHLVQLEIHDKERTVRLPLRFDPGFRVDKTNLVSQMVEIWGEVPFQYLRHLDFRHSTYGYIGAKDYTLYPLVRPGTFVQINDKLTRIQAYPWRNEYERPIYFLELRDGYACGWCELHGKQLLLLPHPLSGCTARQFAYPTEAEIVGRVTALAMQIVNPPGSSHDEPSKLPKQS